MEVHSLGRYLLLSQEVTTWEFISRRSLHRRPIQQDVGINRCTGVPLHTHMLGPTSEKLNQFCRNDVDISDVAQRNTDTRLAKSLHVRQAVLHHDCSL